MENIKLIYMPACFHNIVHIADFPFQLQNFPVIKYLLGQLNFKIIPSFSFQFKQSLVTESHIRLTLLLCLYNEPCYLQFLPETTRVLHYDQHV